MKTIDAQKIALKILRFDVLKYPSTSSKAVMRREFKFIAGEYYFACNVSAREAKTAKDALAVAVSRLAQSQNVSFTNMPLVQIVSDQNAAEWVRS
jgi:hypothetical protein